MDRLDRDLLKEWQERKEKVARKYDIVTPAKRPEIEVAEIPEAMQAPEGELYAVFKRSNLGYNRKLFLNLPLKEATFWTNVLNKRERNKRANLPIEPEEVFFYDPVLHNSAAESPYWNPSGLFTDDSLTMGKVYEDLH